MGVNFDELRRLSGRQAPTPYQPQPIQSPLKPQTSVKPPVAYEPPAPIAPKKPTFVQNAASGALNIAQKAFKALALPGQKVESLLTKGRGYEASIDIADSQRAETKKRGGIIGTLAKIPQMQDFVPKGVKAFASRAVLDPLNAVPLIKGGKILSKVGEVTGVTKKLAPLAYKAKNIINPVLNLSEDLATKVKLSGAKASLRGEEYIKRMAPKVQGMSTEARRAAADLLMKSKKAKDVLKEFTPEVKTQIKAFVKEADSQRIEQLKNLKKLGVITKDEYRSWKKNVSKYYHSTDFDTPVDASTDLLQRAKEGITTGSGFLRKKLGKEGFTMDAPVAVAKRQIKQFLVEERAKVLNSVIKNKDLARKVRKTVPPGFVKVTGDFLKNRRMLKGYAVKQEIFDALVNNTDIIEKMAKTGNPVLLEGAKFLNGVDAIGKTFNRLWKPIVTGMNPAFHAQNIIGNLHNMALGGVRDPRRFLQAVFGGVTKQEAEIARSGGVLNGGQIMEAVGETLGDINTLKQRGTIRKILDFLPRMGTKTENNARAAMYNDALSKALAKGMTRSQANLEAFRQTNKFLFDYATGLGPNEKFFRSIIPFYAWTRFNTPLQVRQFFAQPAFYALQSKISQTVEPEDKGIPSDRGFSIPIGKSGVRLSPNTPTNSLFDLGKMGITARNQVSPLIKDSSTIVNNLMGGDAGQYVYGGMKGKPIIPRGRSAEGVLKEGILPFLENRLRPVKDIHTIAKNPTDIPTILKTLFGGISRENPEQDRLNEVNQKNEKLRSRAAEMDAAIKAKDRGWFNRLRSKQ